MARIISPFIELIKPRIVVMQVVTVAMGYVVAMAEVPVRLWGLLPLLTGTVLTAAGAASLNHFLERNIDRLMARTQNRPLPTGAVSPDVAALWGFALLGLGLLVLWLWTNTWVVFLSFTTAFLYVIFYTPLKQMTWWNTFVGAVPGAIPPLAGWVAVEGRVSAGAWELFWILFFWQLPHFFAIAWICKDDYAKAGFKMLSVEDPTGQRTFVQMALHTVLLVIASFVPVLTGRLGGIYLAAAVTLGVWLFWSVLAFRTNRSVPVARVIMRVSVIYLPLLLLGILADLVVFRLL